MASTAEPMTDTEATSFSPSNEKVTSPKTRPSSRSGLKKKKSGRKSSPTRPVSPLRRRALSPPKRTKTKEPLPSFKKESPPAFKKDPLPTFKRSSRNERRSFQGLEMYEKKGKNDSSSKKTLDPAKIEKMRGERRMKSMDLMRNSAQSDQIRNILEDTLDECMDVGEKPLELQTAEEKLQAVMTKAKERGMGTEDIFKFFNGGNPNTTKITKASFLGSVDKIANSLLKITEQELDGIVKKFDKNGDGQICIVEFKDYCYYQIPSVAWRAERTRLENSGEMKKLRAQLSRRFSIHAITTENSIDTKEVLADDEKPCGNEVLRTSKLFWKTSNNLEIRVFFTEILNVITLQLYSQQSESELPSVYVCRNKVEAQHASTQIADTKEGASKTWKSISDHLIERLRLKNGPLSQIVEVGFPKEECSHIPQDSDSLIPYLGKLDGDMYDTLMIQKPLNLEPPPPIASGNKLSNDFDRKMQSFCKAKRKARNSRKSAEDLSNVLASVLAEHEKK